MSRKKFIAIIILFFNAFAAAQEINVPAVRGARNDAMGNALISEANDISAIYLNPASLVFVKENSIFLNHGQLNNKLGMTENFAVPLLRIKPVTLSLGLESYHLGYLKENSAFPQQHIFELGYSITAAANAFAQTFSIGATVGFRYGKTDLSKAWAGYYSIGINYSPSSDINYGIALSGLGDDIRYLMIDSTLSISKKNANKKLVLGASMKYPSSSSLRRTVFVLALANEKIFGEEGLLYKTGIEIRPWQFLSFRLGYVFGPEVSEPRFGAGAIFNPLVIEYVFYAGPAPVMLQQFSLSIKM
ncbi:MAG: hypothetical protein A2068_03700 [Ignavibacteria bacterium GWB2_35_6b]|nr:MAG: hypothetical protein A2068_03700 [Ignavibacteria bacterium GWB2_35_6b]